MRFFLTTLFLLGGTMLFAQDSYIYFNLDMNKPLSNTSWIGDASARGFRAGYRKFINTNFSAGLDVHLNSFDEYKEKETRETAGGAFTTDYFNYIYAYSIAVSGQYNFKKTEDQNFFPYVGLGLGAQNNEYVVYYNIYSDSERSWGFLMRPEAGLLFRFGARKNIAAMAAVHYDYATNDSENYNYNGFSSVGFQIGIAFTGR